MQRLEKGSERCVHTYIRDIHRGQSVWIRRITCVWGGMKLAFPWPQLVWNDPTSEHLIRGIGPL